MENLSMSEKRKNKLKDEAQVKVATTINDVAVDVTELITKCDALITEASELYLSNSSKELSDAIIILHSANRSLQLVSLN
jgi:hypothetical protein